MVLTLLILTTSWYQNDPITFIKPLDPTFAGKTEFRLRADVAEDDVIGLDLRVNDETIHYFEEPPYEATVDMVAYPAGPIEVVAVLEQFDGTVHQEVFRGNNVHPDVEEQYNLIRIPVLSEKPGFSFQLEDFSIFENNLPQKPQMLLGQEKPLYLLILLDMSTSMERRLFLLRKSMDSLLERIRPGDVVQIIGFNHRVFEVCAPETDINVVREQLKLMEAKGDTNLYGALFSGIKVLGKANDRRALLLFTDGDHTVKEKDDLYQKDLEDCISLARDNGVPVYSVGFGVGVNKKNLDRLASETGGKAFFRTAPKRLEEAFDTIGGELHQQYLLCYYTSSHRPGSHKIRIEVNSKDASLIYPKEVYFK